MSTTVFWSWQSDKPGKISRHFLKGVLEDALLQAGQDLDLNESDRPSLDHDTKGEAGLVSIPDSILAKIDAADVFVADLTPVAQSPEGRFVANPNVLIELGYAKKSLGPSQIILIWNAAWGGCNPEDLPFDLRHRRMPFTYSLDEAASSEEIVKAKSSLVSPLKGALLASLSNNSIAREKSKREAIGVEPRENDPSVWFAEGTTFVVNSATSFGADHIRFSEGPRSYLRVIPTVWPNIGASRVMEEHNADFEPLGDGMGRSKGRTRGGIISYRAQERDEQNVISNSATQWFNLTGELWGFDGKITFDDDQGRATLATHYVVECWSRFLRQAEIFYSLFEAQGPFRIMGGITHLDGVCWPKDLWPDREESLEESMCISRAIDALDKQTRLEMLSDLHTAMRDIFGFGEAPSELEKILREARR